MDVVHRDGVTGERILFTLRGRFTRLDRSLDAKQYEA